MPVENAGAADICELVRDKVGFLFFFPLRLCVWWWLIVV